MISSQKEVYLGLLLVGGLMLAGCQNKAQTVITPAPTAPAPQVTTVQPPPEQINVPQPQPVEARKGKIGLCQNELASLKQISPKAYAAKKAYFDRLVDNASVYSAVRGEVNAATKDTLDALYKYKTNLICADIEREVLQGLIQRGESVK